MPGALASSTRIAASVLGILSGLIGMYHGYNEVLQGSAPTNGIFVNAIGPPCTGSSCFPAMTLIPNFQVTGIIAILVSLVILAWSAGLVQRSRGGVILIGLSVIQLLVGGGFLPPILGIVGGLVATRIRRPTT